MTRASGWRIIALSGLLLALLAAALPVVSGQGTGNCAYSAKTGFWVCGELRTFYEAHGGPAFLGLPLTRAFNDPALGVTAQVFERGRLEWLPEQPEGRRVRLGALVDELGYSFAEGPTLLPSPLGASLLAYYPESGHSVSYAFLQYLRSHGGVEVFGFPRSEALEERGRTVQYFQSVRMEWRPELEEGPAIVLADLGYAYLDRFAVAGQITEPEAGPDTEPAISRSPVQQLRVSASVREVVIGTGGTQLVYAYVVDQAGQPVQDVPVGAGRHQGSDAAPAACCRTNALGFCSCPLEVPQVAPGEAVAVTVTAAFEDLRTETSTSYLVWW